MLLTLSFSTESKFLRSQILTRKYSVRIRGLFSIFHQYFTAEANLEEDNTSNVIPPPSAEKFFLICISCESDAKSYECDIFHFCTSVICYHVSTALANTSAGPLSLKQNGVFTYHTTSGCTDQHTADAPHTVLHLGGGVLLVMMCAWPPLAIV